MSSLRAPGRGDQLWARPGYRHAEGWSALVEVLRVGVRLPSERSVAVVEYLRGQPLLPIWRLAVANIGALDEGNVPIELAVTTPALFDTLTPPDRPRVPVVLAVERDADQDLSMLVGSPGVRGMVFPDDPPETLALGIAAAASHGVWLPVAFWQQLERSAAAAAVRASSLTPAETETLRLIARGMTNSEIARVRHVQTSTVKYHVRNVLIKTGATSRHELIVLANHRGASGREKDSH